MHRTLRVPLLKAVVSLGTSVYLLFAYTHQIIPIDKHTDDATYTLRRPFEFRIENLEKRFGELTLQAT